MSNEYITNFLIGYTTSSFTSSVIAFGTLDDMKKYQNLLNECSHFVSSDQLSYIVFNSQRFLKDEEDKLKLYHYLSLNKASQLVNKLTLLLIDENASHNAIISILHEMIKEV